MDKFLIEQAEIATRFLRDLTGRRNSFFAIIFCVISTVLGLSLLVFLKLWFFGLIYAWGQIGSIKIIRVLMILEDIAEDTNQPIPNAAKSHYGSMARYVQYAFGIICLICLIASPSPEALSLVLWSTTETIYILIITCDIYPRTGSKLKEWLKRLLPSTSPQLQPIGVES